MAQFNFDNWALLLMSLAEIGEALNYHDKKIHGGFVSSSAHVGRGGEPPLAF
jgi:hypothetical protein